MDEILDIFNKDGIKVGMMTKRFYYSQTGEVPWIKCCSCFVVDRENRKVLFEKRGNTLIDAGKLDLCSGHVKSGELPTVAMTRELNEELGIPPSIASNINHLGNTLIDCSTLTDSTNRKNMKCITSIYSLEVAPSTKIQIDNDEVVSFAWLPLEDARAFIENGMTRMPYEESLKEQYEGIFQRLESFISREN